MRFWLPNEKVLYNYRYLHLQCYYHYAKSGFFCALSFSLSCWREGLQQLFVCTQCFLPSQTLSQAPSGATSHGISAFPLRHKYLHHIQVASSVLMKILKQFIALYGFKFDFMKRETHKEPFQALTELQQIGPAHRNKNTPTQGSFKEKLCASSWDQGGVFEFSETKPYKERFRFLSTGWKSNCAVQNSSMKSNTIR